MTTAIATSELPAPSRLPAQPTPVRFFETLHAYQRTAALKAAIELELFTVIGDGAASVPEIASRTKVAERGVRVLCDFLVVLGFLNKAEGRYGLSVDSAMFLDKKSPAYAGDAAKFIVSDFILDRFRDFTSLVRDGGPAPEAAQRGVDDPMWVEFARCMGPLIYEVAERTQALLHTKECVKILDVAAGHGLFGISFARHNPKAEVFALDAAPVLEVAAANAKRFGVSGRWHALPGDALEVPFGTGFDLVLVPNLLHHWDRPTIQHFLKRVYHALAPKGQIAIVEFTPNDDRVSPPIPASFVMNMFAMTSAGDAYPASEYRSMLLQSGFEGPQVHPLLPLPHTVLVAGTI